MLGKLLKYELRAQGKGVLPMFAGTLAIAIMTRVLSILVTSMPILSSFYGIMMTILILCLVGSALWTMVVSIKRFYDNLLKDEGYLTNTLPVTRSQIIFSKEIASVIMMFVAVVVIVLSFWIGIYHGDVKDLVHQIMLSADNAGMDAALFLWWALGLILVGYISNIQLCFTALLLGQTKNNNKIISAIAFGILLYIGMQMLSLFGLGIDILIRPDLMEVMNQSNASLSQAFDYAILVFISSTIVTLISIIGFHIFSVYLANHKLNLE